MGISYYGSNRIDGRDCHGVKTISKTATWVKNDIFGDMKQGKRIEDNTLENFSNTER